MEQLKELKKDICTGHNQLTAGQDKMAACQKQLWKDIRAGQQELKKWVSAYHDQVAACQKELKSKMSDINVAQGEFEETITHQTYTW
jgi:hypothetical protein